MVKKLELSHSVSFIFITSLLSSFESTGLVTKDSARIFLLNSFIPELKHFYW